jgi:hypothetical protein
MVDFPVGGFNDVSAVFSMLPVNGGDDLSFHLDYSVFTLLFLDRLATKEEGS